MAWQRGEKRQEIEHRGLKRLGREGQEAWVQWHGKEGGRGKVERTKRAENAGQWVERYGSGGLAKRAKESLQGHTMLPFFPFGVFKSSRLSAPCVSLLGGWQYDLS